MKKFGTKSPLNVDWGKQAKTLSNENHTMITRYSTSLFLTGQSKLTRALHAAG
jgi:hypothetical protein